MIHPLFLRKAENIRKEYIEIVRGIEHYENLSKDLVQALNEKTHELELLLSNINEGKIKDIEIAKERLNVIMVDTEQSVNEVDNKISILTNRMDKLREEEMSLYMELREKYIEYSDANLKQIISAHLINKGVS